MTTGSRAPESVLRFRLQETEDPAASAHAETKEASSAAGDETLYLIGRPTLKQFLRFARGHAVDPPAEAVLAQEWEEARGRVRALTDEEAGIADDPPRVGLGREREALLIEFLKDPLVRHGFNTVPTEVATVNLDSMVVYQKHIDLTFARQLEASLGPAPGEEQIFRTCLPYDHPQPPVKWAGVRRDGFVFVSPSNDLRFLGAMRMERQHIKDYPP